MKKEIQKLQFISQKVKNFSHIEIIEKACEAGVNWIQLRIKNETEQTILEKAKEAKKICSFHKTNLIINDHPQIAKETNAEGVHLGKNDESIVKARKLLGENFIIGGTANTFEDIIEHYKNGVDYIGLGPYKFTSTKKNLSPVLGLEGYKNIINKCQLEKIKIPIVAIGGIETKDILPIMKTGVWGIAVSSLIAKAENLQERTEEILNILKNN